MANPLVPQGTISRLRASVVFDDYPNLNITASWLAPEGISITFEGDATDVLDTMTGVVTSPAPYQKALLEVGLVRSVPFTDQFKQQIESNSVVGDFTLWPDAPALSNYVLLNGSLVNLQPGAMNGKKVDLVLTMRALYPINSDLFT